MSNISETLESLAQLAGAQSAALVDSESGMVLGQSGSSADVEVSAAGNTEVIRSQLKALKTVGEDELIDDILITVSSQYQIMRPLRANPSIFLYVALDKNKANLALARIRVAECEAQLTL